MKYILLNSGTIANNKPEAMGKFIFPLVEFYVSQNKKVVAYFLASKSNSSPCIKTLSPIFNFISTQIRRANKYIFKCEGYKIYYGSKKWYDYFASQKITEGCTLIYAALLTKTALKNKSMGGKNILLLGNPDNRDIAQIYMDEQKKYGVKLDDDVYTYKKGLDYYVETLRCADHIIVLSQVAFDSIIKRVDQRKVSIFPCKLLPLLDNKRIVIRNNKLTFCFIAYPHWLKGLPHLLEAWAKIENNDITLRVGGALNKPLREFIEKQYGGLKNVEYWGHIKDVNEFCAPCHVGIVPSLLDAGPVTVLEMMNCGLPVIVSEGCGYNVVVENGINGFTYPPYDIEALYNKLVWFINHQDIIPEMGKAALETIVREQKIPSQQLLSDHVEKVIKLLNKTSTGDIK